MSDSRSYDIDGLRLRIDVTESDPADPLPASFGWAQALAKLSLGGATVVAGTATPDGTSVACIWAPDALSAGVWRVQVRAGATSGDARMIYDEDMTIHRALRPTP